MDRTCLTARVEHFHRGKFVGEVPTASGRSPEAGVEGFDRDGGVDDFADLDREVQERDELGPGVAPEFDHRRILGVPLVGERFELDLGDFWCRGGVDPSELGGGLLPVLAGGVTQHNEFRTR